MELNAASSGFPGMAQRLAQTLGSLDCVERSRSSQLSGCSEYDPSRVLEQLFECPSSNERNTNTLFSGSESDAMKTPSVGSDSPGFGLQEVLNGVALPSVASGCAMLSAPAVDVFSPPSLVNSPGLLAMPMCSPPMPVQPPPPPLPLSVRGFQHQLPLAPAPMLLQSVMPAVTETVSTVPAALYHAGSAVVSAPATTAASADPLSPSGADHRNPDCACLLCDMTFRPRTRPMTATRGRPPKFTARTYRSQLCASGNSLKLTIRLEPSAAGATAAPAARGRRRRRRSRHRVDSDDDDDDADVTERSTMRGGRRRGKHRRPGGGGGGGASGSDTTAAALSDQPMAEPSGAQSGWADSSRMPPELLRRIFGLVVEEEGGAVPCMVHATRVCRLWRGVALEPSLWRAVDLNCPLVPEYQRHVRTLLHLTETHLSQTEELSLAGWQNAVGPAAITLLCDSCPCLQSLSLSGCRSLTSDQLLELAQRLAQLQQLDLSDVQPNAGSSRSPVSPQSVQELVDVLGGRLLSLNLSHNCVTGIPAIVDTLASHCPCLEVLDLSNMLSMVRDVVPVHIERLQEGCPKLRVLRWTNTQLKLADTSIKEQIAAGGFPELEELSVAVPRGASWGLDDSGIERLLKTSRRLLLLDVRGCERLTDAGLVRVPAWNLQQLHLSGTQAARLGVDSRLELVVRKWRHSLQELDLGWASHQAALDAAMSALAERDEPAPSALRRLHLAGSAVSFGPVARLVLVARQLQQVDLTSCRSLPRGVKRPHVGSVQLAALRQQILDGRFGELDQ